MINNMKSNAITDAAFEKLYANHPMDKEEIDKIHKIMSIKKQETN